MFTKHILIQNIEKSGKATFYQVSSNNFQWAFETNRTKTEGDPEFFPITLYGNDLNVVKRVPGPETKLFVKDNEITFCDDYAVPEGFVIAIIFPENFIPDILKFKDKPIIPVRLQGQFVAVAQGQFQIFYNRLMKKSAIVFHIHENICFGFKCIAKKVGDDKFPANESVISDDFFDITISPELLQIESIRTNDLKLLNETLDKTDLEDVSNNINEILLALKAQDKSKASSSLEKLGKLIINGIGIGGNLTKIIDSYNKGGAPHKFVAKLLEYINL